MTILPTGPATKATPLTPDGATDPGDFMAAIEQALAAALGMPAVAPVAVQPVQPPAVGSPVAVTSPGFETVAAQPPQPPVVGTKPVVELAETPATDAPKATTPPGFETVAAQPPQPPVVSPKPVVELAETPGARATTATTTPTPTAAATAAPDKSRADTNAEPNDGQAQQSPAPSTLPLTSSVLLPTSTPAITNTNTHTPVPASVVHAQVFGEVTSLASRGPGTHRITLTLNPESLGPVRVVMTVRDGGVQVRLAAGSEAHQALLEGSGELTRLLERAGAGEAHVVVREFTPVTATHSADSGQLNLSTGDRPTDQHAGTRADHPATDGADRLLTRRLPVQQEARPIKPVSEVRTSGLDLTM